MDKIDKNSDLFRSIPVHFFSDYEQDDAFPENIRSFNRLAYTKVMRKSPIFRSISVHFYRFFSYLCTGSDNRTSTTMAGTVKDMSLIKQVLQLKQLGESNRGISRKLSINKETVNSYVKTMRANGWIINDLLRKEDPELERLFHAGSPAYSDPRMTDFLARLPYFREQLTNPKLHVTRQLLYEEYIKCYPNGYGKSQFYFQPELIKNIIRKAIQRAINCASDPICWENGKRGSIELCCLLLMCYGI